MAEEHVEFRVITPKVQQALLAQQTRLRDRARLLISCPDRPGIVAAVSQFLYQQGANIVQSDQHSTDPSSGLFFMRIEFELPNLGAHWDELTGRFAEVARTFQMTWRFNRAHVPKRMAVFVSKEEHCLLELLWQWQSGDLYADLVMVVSNHPDAGATVAPLGIPFYHIPVTPETKKDAEAKQLALLASHKVDLVVLARYMQILSGDFVRQYPNRIINIHHSFLPAFIGRNPYARAYQRGVKLIGATAHYVTEDLDEGPIIEQDVQRVDHRDEVEDLKRIGRQIERTVLVRAVKWHLEDRILTYNNRTIVFR
ncbi:formyltetrahydrofolate deformylase [Alicyclobacillus cellulosilyticus]|uniref:Formyltetrahydrofolate deformylase n=1 Tax=Alicyclobacillus cellulosilyticus TaxID=1003997 RepID=A0A917KC00_9BACL|nr:formyltetrahydrofolate deformylase [Alicyclobacillus cellulosilyticus]